MSKPPRAVYRELESQALIDSDGFSRVARVSWLALPTDSERRGDSRAGGPPSEQAALKRAPVEKGIAMSAEPIITVVLRPTNVFTRSGCLFCGGASGNEAVNADVFSAVVNARPGQTGMDWTGLVVCGRCLASDNIPEIIRENAAWHRERAAQLEAIAANLPPLPTYAEWQQAQKNADAARGVGTN
jgi:hypothetical protein